MRALALALVAAAAAWGCGPLPPLPPALRDAANANRRPRADVAAGLSRQRFAHPKAPGGALDYLLYLPEGFDRRAEPLPVILYLHGSSQRGSDLSLLTRYGLPRRLERERDFPWIVVAPQLAAGERWTELEPLAALVDETLATLPADPERVYVTGFSMGGGGTWRVANAYPDRFAACAPLGATRDDSPITGLERVPVWAFHGSDDESTPVTDSELMVESVIEAGGDARLTVVPGGDHDSVLSVYDEPELFEWFLEHRKFAVAPAPVEAAPANESRR